MTAKLLDGKLVAAKIYDDLRARVGRLKRDFGVTPGLGTVLVGDNPSSRRYVEMKHEDCAAVGIVSVDERLPAHATEAELDAVTSALNANPAVHAYLVQLPLPSQLDELTALLSVDPKKDADGLHPVNLGRLVMGEEGPLPCTPAGIVELLRAYEVPVEGRDVTIIGRGLTIGRPLSLLMSLKRPGCNAAVTVVHTAAASFVDHIQGADVVIAAAGSAGLVNAAMVKPGAAVVAAGTPFVDGKLASDVTEDVRQVAGWMTPPKVGGVGPMTRAMLLSNAVVAAEKAVGAR
jgi:methylenetetrahydrofolate dehydrogenase (NADP+)/methenyltetrahydrofolate cyclohydrolase